MTKSKALRPLATTSATLCKKWLVTGEIGKVYREKIVRAVQVLSKIQKVSNNMNISTRPIEKRSLERDDKSE